MVIISKKTFEVFTSDSADALKEEYFECDELIAPSISLLNLKGYTTMNSCAGHGFIRNGVVTVFSKNDADISIPGTYRIEKKDENFEGIYNLYFKQWVHLEAYIQFKKDYMPYVWSTRRKRHFHI